MMREPKMDLGGVIVATALAFKPDESAPAGLAVDYDKFGEHVDFLMSCPPRTPLTPEQHARVTADTERALAGLAARR